MIFFTTLVKVVTTLVEEFVSIEKESEEFLKVEAEMKLEIDYYWTFFSTVERPFDVKLARFEFYNQTEEYKNDQNNKTEPSSAAKLMRKKRSDENSTETCNPDAIVTRIIIYFHMDKLANASEIANAKALLIKMYVAVFSFVRHYN